MRLSSAFLFFIVGYNSTASCGANGLCNRTCFCIPEEGEPCPEDSGKRRTALDYFQSEDYLKFADLMLKAGKKSGRKSSKKIGKKAGHPGQLRPTLVPEGCQPYSDVQAVIGGTSCREPESLENNYCVFKYSDDCSYELKNIPNTNRLKKDEVITHVDACGVCSNAQDLAVYMNPGVAVSSFLAGLPFGLALLAGQPSQVLAGIFATIVVPQFESIVGFTPDCAYVWGSNSANSAINGCTEDCVDWLEDCVPSSFGINPFTNAPFAGDPMGRDCQRALLLATDDCVLNACLSCDELVSGSIFQLYAGRTRRKSGILTTVDLGGGAGFVGLKRDCDSLADIAQIPCTD